MTNKILVFSTCESKEEAERLAKALLEARLAACVNVITQIRSFYWWQEKIESADESMMVIKTSSDLFDQVRELIQEKHSYDVPEIIAIPITAGSPAYLNWLGGELAEPGQTRDSF
ncbi:MAG TPA: divalent-cation tolerance protein CutA [Bryobacteraceae bacterium]|nr:divalent-cation tolerance protein CutA [Bryobacteraceae bacterium]